VFTAPNYYAPSVASQIGLRPGERMSVHDLLLALLLPSADDAAEDLAHNVGGSVGTFIGMMNARARELGLTRTHYSTPIGFDTQGNYSSASDLVKLASFLLTHHPFFAHAVASPSAVLRTGNYRRYISNRNTLIGRVPWVNGVKTGHTRGAGYVLVGSGTRAGMTLISAVLGTPSEGARDSDTMAVLNYGFANFRLAKPVSAGTVLARLPVKDQPGRHADVIAQNAYARVVARGVRLTTKLELPKELNGPLRRHQRVGSIEVFDGRRPLARLPLVVAQSVPAVSPLTAAARFVTKPLSLIALAILVIAGIAFERRRQRLRRRDAERRRRRAAREAARDDRASRSSIQMTSVGSRGDELE